MAAIQETSFELGAGDHGFTTVLALAAIGLVVIAAMGPSCCVRRGRGDGALPALRCPRAPLNSMHRNDEQLLRGRVDGRVHDGPDPGVDITGRWDWGGSSLTARRSVG